MKIAKAIWGVFCLFGIILFVEDFYKSFNHPEVYPFGAEGPVAGIWYYNTLKAYLWSSASLVCWFVVGLLCCLLQHKYQWLKWGITAHCLITLLYFLSVLCMTGCVSKQVENKRELVLIDYNREIYKNKSMPDKDILTRFEIDCAFLYKYATGNFLIAA